MKPTNKIADPAWQDILDRDREINRLTQALEVSRAENARLRKRRNEIDDEAAEYAEQVERLTRELAEAKA